jgi:hypothetical protein
MLARKDVAKRASLARPVRAPALLKGLIFAYDGRAMTPSTTKKNGKYYRYYVNTATIKIGRGASDITRVPAGDIDAAVVDQIRKVLQAPEVTALVLKEIENIAPTTDKREAIQSMQSIDAVWDELFPAEQSRIAHLLIDKVIVSPNGIRIDMKTEGVKELIRSTISVPDERMVA